MADPEMDEDLFADLYDGEADDPAPPVNDEIIEREHTPIPVQFDPQLHSHQAEEADDFNIKTEPNIKIEPGQAAEPMQLVHNAQHDHSDDYDRPIGSKEDGKMFIGGLNWETTDQSLKDYFSQFGEVIDCQVMRDGATGRSRGFGFLTFRDAKTVNIVMVKEHFLDGKLIDPKRAIPREEQERTAKIFVGGVSQECTDVEFREFFEAFGRVLDATLMMDKDTGRPRGFGFVTFDSDAAVDRTLDAPLAIHGKMIEVKRAEPRGNLRDGDGGHGKFGRQNKNVQSYNTGNNNNNNNGGNNDNNQMNPTNQNGQNGMSQAMMAQYWQKMQQYFQVMQQGIMANSGGMNQMAMQNNPMMMRQMMAQQGMNPAMMQQMSSMQGYPGMSNPGSPTNNPQQQQPRPGFNAQEQLMFEQHKYERQQQARVQQGNFQGGDAWDGMYDDVPAPAGMQGANMRGGYGGRGCGGRGSTTPQPLTPAQAPANAPTGPKNAGQPGANYRGGGRGGRRGYHPYARGGM